MDETPSKHPDLELIKLMMENRYKEAGLHLRSYGTMLALNLAVFAAAFGYLSSSESTVGWFVRISMLVFGVLLSAMWWASSFCRIRTVEYWHEQTSSLIRQTDGLPEPFIKAACARFYIDGKNKEIAFEQRLFSLHFPIVFVGIAWCVVTICIGPGSAIG